MRGVTLSHPTHHPLLITRHSSHTHPKGQSQPVRSPGSGRSRIVFAGGSALATGPARALGGAAGMPRRCVFGSLVVVLVISLVLRATGQHPVGVARAADTSATHTFSNTMPIATPISSGVPSA